MYFISEVLSDSKTRYSQIQKLLYSIITDNGTQFTGKKFI